MSKTRKFLYTLLISFVLVKLSNMAFNKIVTIVLPKADFSLYLIVLNSVVMITGISALGMGTSLMRYLIRYDSRNRKKESKDLLSTTMIYTNAFQFLILSFLCIGANMGLMLFPDSNYSYLLILIIVLSYIQLLISLLTIVAYSRFDSLGYFCLTAFPYFLMLGLTVFTVLVGSLWSYSLIYANIIANGLVAFLLLLRLLKTKGLGKFSLTMFKDSLRLAGPLVIAGQLESVSQFFLLTLLYFHYPEAVAVYVIGLSVANMVQIIRQVITIVYSPLVVKYYETGRQKYLNYFVNQTFKIYLTVAIPVLFLIYALSSFLIMLLSTKEYLSGTIVVLFLSATFLIQTGRYMTAFGHIIMRKTNQIALVEILAEIPKIFIGLILIPQVGIAGLAFTILVYHSILFIGEFLVSQKIYKIKFQRSIYAKILILSTFTFTLPFLLYYPFNIPFEFSLFLSVIFFVISVLVLKIITVNDFYFVKFAFFKGEIDIKASQLT